MPPKRHASTGSEEEHASDFAKPDVARIAAALDAIPGAWERTQEGLTQAADGEGTLLDELV